MSSSTLITVFMVLMCFEFVRTWKMPFAVLEQVNSRGSRMRNGMVRFRGQFPSTICVLWISVAGKGRENEAGKWVGKKETKQERWDGVACEKKGERNMVHEQKNRKTCEANGANGCAYSESLNLDDCVCAEVKRMREREAKNACHWGKWIIIDNRWQTERSKRKARDWARDNDGKDGRETNRHHTNKGPINDAKLQPCTKCIAYFP